MSSAKVMSHSDALPLPFSLNCPLFQEFDASSIVVEPVVGLDDRFGQYGGRCMVLRNIISHEECKFIIEKMSSDMAPVQYRSDYRRNDRCIFESPEFAELLWHRIQPTLSGFELCVEEDGAKQRLVSENAGECPHELRLGYGKEGLWRPKGLNECLRFCRYNPGGFFRSHCDAMFCKSEDEQSLLTCMFYLDGNLDGGATRFLHIDSHLTHENYLKPATEEQVLASIAPEPGLCILFFQQGLLHEGEELRSGVKHILRTDVMCHRDPASKPLRTEKQIEAMSLALQAQALEASQDPSELNRACELYRRAFKLDPKLERMF